MKSESNRRSHVFLLMSMVLVVMTVLLIGCEGQGGSENDPGLKSGASQEITSLLDGGPDGGGDEDLIWTQQQALLPDDEDFSDGYGWVIDVDGDYAVVGSRFDDDEGEDAGTAYVYLKEDKLWTLQQKLYGDDTEAGDSFGVSVTIDGDTIVVGANRDQDDGELTGAAYVFVRTGDEWNQQQKIVPDDVESGDEFGYALSVSGDTLLAGSDFDDDQATDAGAAYIYARSGDSWTEVQKLVAPDGQESDAFGLYVSLDGDTAAVASPGGDGDVEDVGAIYVYEKTGDTWEQSQKIVASDGMAQSGFSFDVFLSGDSMIAGAPADVENEIRSGSAYVFTKVGDTWEQQQKLHMDDALEGANFGYSVAISGDTAIVSAPADDDNGEVSGSAYIFTRSGGEWEEKQKISPGDGESLDLFGFAVALIDGTAMVSGTYFPEQGDVGCPTYVFEPTPPLSEGAFCSDDSQCLSGFCVDGVCCDVACGGNNTMDCQACSEAAGVAEDGVCGDLDGTFCDDGDPETFDDFCDMGECLGSLPDEDTDPDTGTDTDTDTETDTGNPGEPGPEDDSCGCNTVGENGIFGLVDLFRLLLAA